MSRIAKSKNEIVQQRFVYQDFLKPVAELDGEGEVVSRFIYATRQNVPDYMVRDGDTYRLVTDHLGSVRLVVHTETGDVIQRMDYDEWGNVLQDTFPGFQPFGFVGGLGRKGSVLAYLQLARLDGTGSRLQIHGLSKWPPDCESEKRSDDATAGLSGFPETGSGVGWSRE